MKDVVRWSQICASGDVYGFLLSKVSSIGVLVDREGVLRVSRLQKFALHARIWRLLFVELFCLTRNSFSSDFLTQIKT